MVQRSLEDPGAAKRREQAAELLRRRKQSRLEDPGPDPSEAEQAEIRRRMEAVRPKGGEGFDTAYRPIISQGNYKLVGQKAIQERVAKVEKQAGARVLAHRFCARLTIYRKRAKISQAALAAEVGMSLSGYRYLEYGQCEPVLRTVLRLARALGITVSQLVGDVECPCV